jgi:hypothetical protein
MDLINIISKHTNLYKREMPMSKSNNYNSLSRRIETIYDPRITQISHTIRNIMHNIHVELPTFRPEHFEKNQDLRIKYMEGLISEEEFKILVQRNDKKNRKNTEISQIITLCNTTVTDIIYRLHTYIRNCKPNEYDEFDKYIIELHEIRKYCNNILREIAFTYNCVQYAFTSDFSFEKTIKEVKEKATKNASSKEVEDNQL